VTTSGTRFPARADARSARAAPSPPSSAPAGSGAAYASPRRLDREPGFAACLAQQLPRHGSLDDIEAAIANRTLMRAVCRIGCTVAIVRPTSRRGDAEAFADEDRRLPAFASVIE
jgi:hypothetical protein